MYKFSNFTAKANEALNIAIESAESMGHNYIGSEHILLGLLKEGTGVASVALHECGAEADTILEMIKNTTGVGSATKLNPNDFTPRAKRILEIAYQSARGMFHNYVGTEHLLIAILQEQDSYAVSYLNACGVQEEDILRVLSGAISVDDQQYNSTDKKGEKSSGTSSETLEKYGKDLTALAKEGKIDPVIGREKEIQRVIQILSRRTKNNPCLIGEPGVGKTAIAEGLALQIAKDEVPELLRNKRIISLDLTSMVAGTKYRGDFEERIQKAVEEVKASKDIILFIDEVHTIIGSGSAEGAVDAANILKPSLARGELQVIGATTIDEYRKYIEKDAALERRFQSILVGEPTEEEAIEILKGLRDKYEAHHKVKITDEAIESAVKMSGCCHASVGRDRGASFLDCSQDRRHSPGCSM